jgi:hypothetical protein
MCPQGSRVLDDEQIYFEIKNLIDTMPQMHWKIIARCGRLLNRYNFSALPSAGGELRRHMRFVMPKMILSHLTTMDRVAAAFLDGEPGQADFDVSRLPLPGVAE